MILADAASLETARAQNAPGALTTAKGANATAGHDIVMNAHVAPSCRVTNAAPQIRLTGTADNGQAIDTTVSGSGGFIVDCNTPYAIQLARSAVYATAPQRTTIAAKEAAPGDTPVADADEARAVLADARDMDVVMRVTGRDGPIESHCVMGDGGTSPFVCQAISGPEDARLPLPRAAASMIITGALADPPVTAAGSETNPPPGQGAQQEARTHRAAVGPTKEKARRVYLGDRLTVSLTARF